MNLCHDMIDERRNFGRRQMTVHAWVQIGGQRVPCTLSNLSDRGALIEFDELAPQANRLRLYLDFQDFEVECEVKHRQATALGLLFCVPDRPVARRKPMTGEEMAQRVRSQIRAQTMA